MSHQQTSLNSFSKLNFSLRLQPAQAWTAILSLVFFSALCILAGAGSILRIAFPVGALAVGVFLYRYYPILYVGFTWWLWFLTPLVARLVDYRNGWFDEQRLMQTSPYLVTLLTLVTFLRHLPKAYRQGGLPFILASTGVFYGSLVGLIQNSPFAVARSLLDWLTPILFGFHLFVNWRDYPSYRQNIQRTFLWGVLLMGVYGVVQYLVAPEWDRFWLVGSRLTNIGSPEPLGIRVWSTMNSPGPFAEAMMVGLLLLFSRQGGLGFAAAGAGYLAFLLTLVRSAWGGWLVGVLSLTTSLKARLQMRLFITILIMAVCVFPLTTIEPFSETINSRLQTLSNLEDDTSFKERSDSYDRQLSLALSSGLGKGIGSTWVANNNGSLQVVVIDSGILDTLFTLGWFGTIPYIGGLVLLLFSLFHYSEVSFDPFMSTARAISLSCFVKLIIDSSILGFSGLTLWGFLGMGMAAHRYYQHQTTLGLGRRPVV